MKIVHMSEKGQIVVPKEIRDKHGFSSGSAFVVYESQSGQLIFRPIKSEPRRSLIDYLQGFKGLDVPEIKAHCPPRL